MDITLIYFCQTGNTRRVAEAMVEVFRGPDMTPAPSPLGRHRLRMQSGAIFWA